MKDDTNFDTLCAWNEIVNKNVNIWSLVGDVWLGVWYGCMHCWICYSTGYVAHESSYHLNEDRTCSHHWTLHSTIQYSRWPSCDTPGYMYDSVLLWVEM